MKIPTLVENIFDLLRDLPSENSTLRSTTRRSERVRKRLSGVYRCFASLSGVFIAFKLQTDEESALQEL